MNKIKRKEPRHHVFNFGKDYFDKLEEEYERNRPTRFSEYILIGLSGILLATSIYLFCLAFWSIF